MTKISNPNVVDWESVERAYRAGVMSVREIAKQNGTKESTIRSRAEKLEWQRDLTEQVRDRARQKLSRTASRTTNADDESIIEEGSAQVAEVVRSHRRDIGQSRSVFGMLMAELESETSGKDVLREIIEQHIDDQELSPQAANAIRKAVTLPSRAGVLRDLSQAAQRLIALERQAFNVDDDKGEGSYEDRLRALIDENC